MANAVKENNRVNTILGTSDGDGVTPLLVLADPASHVVCNENGTGGSDLSGDDAPRDENRVTALMAVSSADGVTPIQLYINAATGDLLTKSS